MALERTSLWDALRNVIDIFPGDMDLCIRMVLDLEDFVGNIYIMAEILNAPQPEAYHSGVRVITCRLQRDNPKAKLTASIPVAEKILG